jgi:hypothetical protein
MTAIILEVPDDFATQLQRDPALLQALLREVVNAPVLEDLLELAGRACVMLPQA